MEQLYRHDLILRLLPGKDNPLNSQAIHQRVINQGIEADIRTVQRDLKELSQKYPHVRSRKENKANVWWAEKSLSRLSMLPTDAMNLVMIMDHAARFGMAAQVEKLAPIREYARSLLKGKHLDQDYSGKVISNTRFVTLEAGAVKPEVLEILQQALLDESSVEVSYLKRGASAPKSLLLRPLGLSYQDSNIYLSCVFRGLPPGNIAALPLHRFISARTTFEDLPAPPDYDINSVAAQRSLVNLKSDQPVRLELRVSPTLCERLQENALAADQHLHADADGWWRLSANLYLSQGLELWLLGQGEHVEVLEPASLREQMRAIALSMVRLYDKG